MSASPAPEVGEDYWESVAMLEAVLETKGTFTVIEVGAGYGHWSVTEDRLRDALALTW